ncbi:hypothetical protein AUJ65_05895 [Candidatus Micrarchaeota archaeon CG1_02_51_15]|nr:MAG: hypothetical protein AUJ65_05895 [Candidatus Micrarchaeota archaeon CG1_02_51_15]
MDKRIEAVLLLAAVALSLWTHSLVLQNFYMPTYGNTGIHAAPIREFAETGFYSREDHFSYGGGVPSTYVPLYRAGIASFVMLTGISVEAASRLWVMLVALLVPLGFYLLAKKIWGSETGLIAAFLASVPADLLIYTIRPLPQAIAMALIPLVLWLVLERKWIPALLLTAVTVWTHQEAGLYLVAVQFGVAFIVLLERAWIHLSKKHVNDACKERKAIAVLSIACWAAGALAYIIWHFAVTGDVNFLAMNQFVLHEGTAVTFTTFITQLGWTLLALSAVGVLAILGSAFKNKKWFSAGELIALSAVVSGIILAKNELIGLSVLMQRFIAFLDQGMILIAAFGAWWIISRLVGGSVEKAIENVKHRFVKPKHAHYY